MSIELNPVGVACNLACTYCYENSLRDAGNFKVDGYDLDAMKAGLEREHWRFSLFGGEPLLMPIEDLEEIYRWGTERLPVWGCDPAKYGGLGIQTNGSLMTDRHIEIFARYNVGVGVSIDGPGEMNDARWAGSLEKTRANTEKTLAAVRKLCAAGRPPSLIVTLHQGNAVGERRQALKAWLLEMGALGVRSVRLHVLEVDSAAVEAHLALSTAEAMEAILDLSTVPGISADLLGDVEALLRGEDESSPGHAKTTCTWNACDPLTTQAVQGIGADGASYNCTRTNKDGINWLKAGAPGYERYLALYTTPQEDGGCQGCRFFVGCKGQCPGTAIDGDWRNKTRDCPMWMGLFELVEQRLVEGGVVPVSLHPKRPEIEGAMLAEWAAGRNTSVRRALEAAVTGSEPGAASSPKRSAHIDTPHIDTPHLDTPHIDSTSPRLLPMASAEVRP